jgi:hypothetical protein
MFCSEAANTNITVFGLTRPGLLGLTQPGLEPIIYRIQYKHANYYITDSKLEFAPQYCKLNGEAANTNFIVFGLIQPDLPQSRRAHR